MITQPTNPLQLDDNVIVIEGSENQFLFLAQNITYPRGGGEGRGARLLSDIW